MPIYPVTVTQFNNVTKRKHRYEDYRIATKYDVARSLPFPTGRGDNLLGVKVEDGKFVENGRFHGTLYKVTQFLTKHGEDLTIQGCTAYFRSIKLTQPKGPEDLSKPISVTPKAFIINYTITRTVPDKLMAQLEDNLQLLKETRKQVAAEKARARRAKSPRSKNKEIQDAINLLKENGMCVIPLSSLDCKQSTQGPS